MPTAWDHQRDRELMLAIQSLVTKMDYEFLAEKMNCTPVAVRRHLDSLRAKLADKGSLSSPEKSPAKQSTTKKAPKKSTKCEAYESEPDIQDGANEELVPSDDQPALNKVTAKKAAAKKRRAKETPIKPLKRKASDAELTS